MLNELELVELHITENLKIREVQSTSLFLYCLNKIAGYVFKG